MTTTIKRYYVTLIIFILSNLSVYAQYFPPASSLMTGQGSAGSLDPIWTVSGLWYTAAIPTAADLNMDVFSPALINNSCAPGAWVDPGSLPSPNNQSNWITGADVDCGNNYGWGYRAFRMNLNLPSDCNGLSVTQPGTYILNLLAYADNSIAQVYINGIATGISGGNYSSSGGVSINLSGPWLVGNNTVDIVVLNYYNGDLNPYGLLVTSNTANVTDTDNDGLNDNDDQCPCTPGNNSQGCITNTFGCDMALIETNVQNAQLVPLAESNSPCKLYYLDTILKSSPDAQVVADGINGTLAVIDSPSLMTTLIASIQEIVLGGHAYFALNDIAVEGTFVYPNGEPVVFTNWNVGEPNNAGDEDCVEILPDGSWNDIACSTLYYAVYEIDLCPTLTISPPIQICYNTSTVVDAMVTNGSLSYTYDWSTGATTPDITVTATVPTTVSVIINDENMCHDTTETSITLFPSEPNGVNSSVTSTGNNTNGDPIYILCEGASLTLTAFGGSGYTWSSGVVNGTSFVPAAGDHFLTCVFTNIHGCQDSVKAEVQVNPFTGVNAGSDVNLCFGDAYVLNATGAVSYVWNNGQSNGDDYNQVIGTSELVVTGTNGNSCSANDTILITVNALPGVTVNSATVCSGDPVFLTAAGAVNYSWSPGTDLSATTGANVSSSSTTTINYTVTGTNANGCVNQAISTVTISPDPTLVLPGDQTICYGETIELNGVSNGTVEWIGYSNNEEITPPAGLHTFTATAASVFGCLVTAQFNVNVVPLPEADFTMSPDSLSIYTPGISFFNTSSGGVIYQWWFGDGTNSTSSDPSHIYEIDPLVDHYITLVTVSAAGCVDSLTRFLPKNQVLVHFVPNTFTPDGDENNNVFLPVLGPGYDQYSYTLYIFNRWGEVLFESHKVEEGWDGTYHGQMSPAGTYLWKILIKEIGIDKPFEYMGSVSLLK